MISTPAAGRWLTLATALAVGSVASSRHGSQSHTPRPRWVLMYFGGPAKYKNRPHYTSDDLMRLVAAVDTAGRPTSWLTTGAILAELYAPSSNVFTNWIGGTPATGADWREYLDTILAAGAPLARLDSVVGALNRAIGPLGDLYRVAVMIPYPDTKVDSIRYDGRLYSLRKPTDGAALAAAYTSDVAAGFRARHFQNLALDAIYWLHETIEGPDTAVVPAVADRVHAAGLRFLWIPYFTASGISEWRKFGFDQAWLQPNYFFTPSVPATRVDSAVVIARRLAMGVELEFDNRLLTSPQHADRLGPYVSRLAAAPDLRAGPIVMYEGAGGLLGLSRAADPWHRAMYQHLVHVLQSADSVIAP